jgi:hypothetical protein
MSRWLRFSPDPHSQIAVRLEAYFCASSLNLLASLFWLKGRDSRGELSFVIISKDSDIRASTAFCKDLALCDSTIKDTILA